MQIETVLCPIDFSTLSDFELKLAVEVCQTFGAHLVLHHNLAAAAPGLHKAWEWEESHQNKPQVVTEPEAHQNMEEILGRIPQAVHAEARISRGPVGLVLLYLIQEISADLVILGSHGWSSEEHTSLSERIIESAPCPVLTVQEGLGDTRVFRLQSGGEPSSRLLVPTDFSESGATAVAYAFELARRTAVDVHLLHVASGDASADEARSRLAELVPADMEPRVTCHVEAGAPADGIMAQAMKVDADLIVMGEHARSFFRRFFTHDTSREMLHRARCPVWFVPAP